MEPKKNLANIKLDWIYGTPMYTRKGDQGRTDSGAGGRVGKDSSVVELEGTLDEFNSFLGLAATRLKWEDMNEDLARIQFEVFTLGEHIYMHGEGRKLTMENTTWLEGRVAHYQKEIGPIRLFIIPGGTEDSAVLHVARTVCRRLERVIASCAEEMKVAREVLSYINRLSSVLFMMALAANRRHGAEEKIWELRSRSVKE